MNTVVGVMLDVSSPGSLLDHTFIDRALPSLLALSCVTGTGINGTCNCFGRIYESRGLGNLTPARSRLFKLIGRKKGSEVELHQALSIYGG